MSRRRSTGENVCNVAAGTTDGIGLATHGTVKAATGMVKSASIALLGEANANLREEDPNPVREVLRSSGDLCCDVAEGLLDVVKEPWEGACRGGGVGFVKGVATGGVSCVGKAAVGTVNLASSIVNGVSMLPYIASRTFLPAGPP